MQKQKLRIHIGEEKSFDAQSYLPEPTAIDDLLHWLSEMKAQGATHIDWRACADSDGDSESVNAQAYLEYEESDEECLDREAKEAERVQRVRDQKTRQERQLYEQLKQKFENQ